MRVAFFDLDRTLIDCNSGRLWVAAEWREGRISVRDAVWASWWLARYTLGHDAGLEAVLEAAARSVKGTSEAELDARVRAWFAREVRHRLRPGGAAALAMHRERGDHLVLATSGTTYAARAAAEAYGLDDVVATDLEAIDGTFTGRARTIAVGDGKARAVEAWAASRGVDLSAAWFYTDSASDLALLERVGTPVVVHPDRVLGRIAHERRWSVVSWGRAEPSGPTGVVS